MQQLSDVIMNILSAISRVLDPLSSFYENQLSMANIIVGWLKPLANLLGDWLGNVG